MLKSYNNLIRKEGSCASPMLFNPNEGFLSSYFQSTEKLTQMSSHRLFMEGRVAGLAIILVGLLKL
jgi:hypothetical protein